MVNFSEDCPKNILLPYLPDIMNRLEQVLQVRNYSMMLTHVNLLMLL